MKTLYFNRIGVAQMAALTITLPFQILPIAEGATQPQDIEVQDIARLCVRVLGVGETGNGKPIGTEGANRYELNGSAITLHLAPVDARGEVRVIISGSYGQVRLRATIVAVVGGGTDTTVTLSPYVFDVAGAGGGADYKTDVYMDGDERVIMERLEDGGTVVFDEHENPIIKRLADGTTQILDAYQSVRVQVDASGEFSVLNNNGHKVIDNHDNTVSLREDNGQERIVLRSDNGEVYINGADGSHKAIDITHGAPGYEITQPTLTLSGQKIEIKQLNKIIFSSDYNSNRDVILGTTANGAGDGKIIFCSGLNAHLTLFSGNTTYGRGSIVLTAEDLTKLRAILNREPSVASVGQYIDEFSQYYNENGDHIEGNNAGIGGFEQPTPDRNDGATPVETFDYPLD